ncbi:MAG: J domain-containing protein [Gammaproteobacteria bacterium]
MASSTHYDTLGIPPSATQEEIAAAFRKHERIWRDTRQNRIKINPKQEAEYLAVCQAYITLSVPVKREAYDQQLNMTETSRVKSILRDNNSSSSSNGQRKTVSFSDDKENKVTTPVKQEAANSVSNTKHKTTVAAAIFTATNKTNSSKLPIDKTELAEFFLGNGKQVNKAQINTKVDAAMKNTPMFISKITGILHCTTETFEKPLQTFLTQKINSTTGQEKANMIEHLKQVTSGLADQETQQ